jgi:hypothetical protein
MRRTRRWLRGLCARGRLRLRTCRRLRQRLWFQRLRGRLRLQRLRRLPLRRLRHWRLLVRYRLPGLRRLHRKLPAMGSLLGSLDQRMLLGRHNLSLAYAGAVSDASSAVRTSC